MRTAVCKHDSSLITRYCLLIITNGRELFTTTEFAAD